MTEKTKVTYPIYTDENLKYLIYLLKKAGVTRNVIIDKKGNIAF